MIVSNDQSYRLHLGSQGGIPDRRPENRPEIHLNQYQTHSLRGGPPLKAVVCHQGQVWITQEKDLQDYVLAPGEIFILTLPGRAVVLALEASRIEIIDNLVPTTNKKSYEQSVCR